MALVSIIPEMMTSCGKYDHDHTAVHRNADYDPRDGELVLVDAGGVGFPSSIYYTKY